MHSPPPTTVAPLPEISRLVSANVYRLGANDLQLVTLRLESGDASEAALHLSFADQEEEATWPVGLDGVYRFNGLTQAARGSWIDAATFTLEAVEFTKTFSGPIQYELHFEADRLRLTSPTFGVTVEGTLSRE